jgi:2',3'-cyclic-nucleotide 2'-phosphodiesterase (5'-nucleotidase family)
MASNYASVIGAHAYFLRDGQTVDSVTVSSSVKPDVDPESNWTDDSLGIINSFQPIVNQQTEEIWGSSPAIMERQDIIVKRKQFDCVLGLEQVNHNVFDMLLGATANAASFVPGGQNTPVKGWLKVQLYRQPSSLISVFDLWCVLETQGNPTMTKGQVFRPSIIAKGMSNALNTGLKQNLS